MLGTLGRRNFAAPVRDQAIHRVAATQRTDKQSSAQLAWSSCSAARASTVAKVTTPCLSLTKALPRRTPASDLTSTMATLARALRTQARHFSRSIKAPQLEPISLREYRIASKLKRRFQPPAHREFMELMNAMQLHDFDTEHPAVIAARQNVEKAKAEAESSRKGQKASTNYHLSRHLRRRR